MVMPQAAKKMKFKQGTRLTSQTKEVILKVYNYFMKLQSKSKSKGAFERTMDATGVSRSSLGRIIDESKKEESFESPTKRYKSSRKTVVTDDFDKDAIRRKIYSIYEHKEHITLPSLVVCCC